MFEPLEEAVTLGLVVGCIGVALGAAGGVAIGFVAGSLLWGLCGRAHPVRTTGAATLLMLGVASALLLHPHPSVRVALPPLICLVVAGPLLLTLRRSLRASLCDQRPPGLR